ncbi:uncharacterized protein LOC125210886 isoform X2 [Salvia hispanica]|uniref:uncharacterized protein LOC125210886 isoform X2 n=1 Tax=Salvia hispanica TaxID=49212 RepID=UPI002009C139|nr:uncharacterized protein LOC125210886 isoform X2 [Salvia hispanica]
MVKHGGEARRSLRSGAASSGSGFHLNIDSNHSLPLSGHKRPNHYSIYRCFVGDTIEVVLPKDKRTGLQQDGEMCSVPSVSQLYDIAGRPFFWRDGGSMPDCQYSHSGCKIVTMANKDSAPVTRAFDSSAEVESVECDWSKHVFPDGDLYHYNCVTCESRHDISGRTLWSSVCNL